MATAGVGESIPPNTVHAVSVSLPTWKSNVAYEEGEEWIVNKMQVGYPRFFVNKLIISFAEEIVQKYGREGQAAMLFPSTRAAARCVIFIKEYSKDTSVFADIRVVDLVLDTTIVTSATLRKASPTVSAVLFPKIIAPIAKQYWQHAGDGVSSRRAEFCHGLLQEGLMVEKSQLKAATNGQARLSKGPKRYQKGSMDQDSDNSHGFGHDQNKSSNGPVGKSLFNGNEARESSLFVEERYGRNLDLSFLENARSAIQRRIAGSLIGAVDLSVPLSAKMETSSRGVSGLAEDDIYLYPTGMNSIFNAHQMMLEARGPLKSISFGFPYVDTLKILQKFGPGCLFYGNASSEDLDDLEKRLESGERYLALFCEFPGNPLLKSPDLQRIKKLADDYDFGIVIDETVGNFINVHVLPYADIVVSSLTKIFTGECNVMGGSGILNPKSRYYKALKSVANTQYEDNYWAEDILFMERNSRDFVSRIERINGNAEMLCDLLAQHPTVKQVYYPKCAPSKQFYDACRTPNGGYGGLLSITFHKKSQAIAFFDRLETAKGPSLGTNFTLTSPYVVLAHYGELEWARSFGVDPDLIRISVGLESTTTLKQIFGEALSAAEAHADA